MSKRTIIHCFFSLVISLFLLESCITTKTLSVDYQPAKVFRDAQYVGTFCSIKTLKSEEKETYYDLATAYMSYQYDSLIKIKVKKMKPVNLIPKMGLTGAGKATTELVSVINQANNKLNNLPMNKRKLYFMSLDDTIRRPYIDSLANTLSSRYSSYFVSYGIVKGVGDYNNDKFINVAANAVAIVAVVALTAVISALLKSNMSSTGVNLNDPDIKYQEGVFCYLLIYDKENHRFCFFRKEYFESDRRNNQPFHPKKLNRQINVIFKEYLSR